MPRLKLTLPASAVYFTRMPNYLIDEVAPLLKDTELRVLIVLVRSTIGWNRQHSAVTMPMAVLRQRTGRGTRALREALASLAAMHLIHCEAASKVYKGHIQAENQRDNKQQRD